MLRSHLKQIVCLAVLLLPCCFSLPAQAEQPNVLLIAIDDLNDWTGFLQGHPQVQTPNMDRLAKRGIVFANAQCAAPLCCPSRAAIFSGRQPFSTGIYGNDQNILKLLPEVTLLPQRFADAGYRTLGTGKLLHHGCERLFEQYFATEQRWSPFDGKRAVEYPAKHLLNKTLNPIYQVDLNGRSISLPLNRMPSDRNPDGKGGESFDWGPFDIDDEAMGDGQITSWAVQQLKEKSDKPFFMAVGYYRPHIPLWAPQKYFDLYPADSIVLPPIFEKDLDDLSGTATSWAREAVTAGAHSTVIKHDQWKPAVAAYLACVSFVDAQVGRLLDALDSSPAADNTVIVLFGDHGWHLGEKEHWGKWTGWERSTRVPFLIVPPLKSTSYARDQQCEQPVGLIDIYPTLLEQCELPAAESLDGQSLVAQLKNTLQATDPELTTFGQGNYSVRDTRWRFVHYQDGSEELYDHGNDPHEWHNLIGEVDTQSAQSRLRSWLPAETRSLK